MKAALNLMTHSSLLSTLLAAESTGVRCIHRTPVQLNSMLIHIAVTYCGKVFPTSSLPSTGVLTHYIQSVGVVDGSKSVLHQAGVVSLVRWNHALHDQGPVLEAHLSPRYRITVVRLADMKELAVKENKKKEMLLCTS